MTKQKKGLLHSLIPGMPAQTIYGPETPNYALRNAQAEADQTTKKSSKVAKKQPRPVSGDDTQPH